MSSAAPRIRVLVVDDSAFVRKVLRELLSERSEFEVVGIARDGLEGLEKIAELAPDVVTLDLVMPNLDGIGVLEQLRQQPAEKVPRVVVVSTSDGQSELALRALELGAVEVLSKPTALATDRLYALREELVRTVRAAAVARPAVGHLGQPAPVPSRPRSAAHRELVVVGASTGGPQALTYLVRSLPKNFPVPMAIALHIPAGYTPALARRLHESSQVEVLEAARDLELRPGRVVLAPGGQHLKVQRQGSLLTCVLTRVPASSAHFPSVDVLLESAAKQVGSGTLALVLTGMGDDGLRGARSIKASGGAVLTESASSCVVYGMPRAIVEAGLSDGDAPIHELAALLLQTL